jgi:hypothetical protein
MLSINNISIVRLKMIFGFLLMVLLSVLAAIIALGKVELATSYGLGQIIGGLLVLSGGFAHWAFGPAAEQAISESPTEDDDPQPK